MLERSPATATFEDDIELIDGWVELRDVTLDGRVLAFPDVEVVELSGVTMRSCRLILPSDVVVRVRNSSLINCDISQVHFKTVTSSRFDGCKMTGTSFLGEMSDLEFRNCRLQLSSLAMTSIDRVAFTECELADVDLLESRLSDVTFEGSQLTGVSGHRANFERVDLRGANPIEVVNVTSLAGCMVGTSQIYEMAPLLAAMVGLQVEPATMSE